MKKVIRPVCALLVCLLVLGSIISPRLLNWRPVLLSLEATSKPVHTRLEDEVLGHLEVESPGGAPRALVFLVAGQGDSTQSTPYAQALIKAGAVVITLDLDHVRAGLASEPHDEEHECYYISDDLKDASRAVQRKLGLKTYLFPVIAGIGEGAPFAFIALAQAPDNTLAGSVSLGFETRLRADRPYCPGPHMTDLGDGFYGFDNATPLPGAWRVIGSPPDEDRTEKFQHPFNDAHFIVAAPDERRDAFVAAALEVGSHGSHGLEELPLSLIRPKGETRALAVIISGDGGWRDIDKSIGEWLAYRGVAVVGIDSLRYFWSERAPEQIARDLDAIFAHYGREFATRRYALIGYSFGADVIPFTWSDLSSMTKARVALVSLLGLGTDAEFEITVEGVLSGASPNSKPVATVLGDLPLARTQCFFGADEAADKETSCTAPEMRGAELIERPGGHHFDGDYDALAARILARLTI
jgi:type IV secretory pathway VirJ component